MLTAELAQRLGTLAKALGADPTYGTAQAKLLADAARRLAVCGGCASCEHAARAASELHGP